MNASRVTVVMSGTSSRVVVDSVMMNDSSKAAIVASIVNNVVVTATVQSGFELGNDLGLDFVYEDFAQNSQSVDRTIEITTRPTVIVLAGGDVDVSSNATVFSKSLVEQNGAMIYTVAVGVDQGGDFQQSLSALSAIASQPVESHALVCSSTRQLSSTPAVLRDSLQQGLVLVFSFYLSVVCVCVCVCVCVSEKDER